MSVYDSRSPAAGVKIMGVPRPKVHVSSSQQRAARTPDTNHKGELVGVLKPHMQGGSSTLGISSVARELQRASSIKATRSRIPGNRRRGHKKPSANLAFGRAIPTTAQYQQRQVLINQAMRERVTRVNDIEGRQELLQLRRTHAAQLKRFGECTDFYLMLRKHVLRRHPHLLNELAQIESGQRRSLT